MALQKIPGTKGKYRSDTRGLAEIGRSQKLGDLALSTARKGAALAKQYDPKGTYTANPRAVRAGWNNETRAGAVITQDKPGPNAIKHDKLGDVLVKLETNRGTP